MNSYLNSWKHLRTQFKKLDSIISNPLFQIEYKTISSDITFNILDIELYDFLNKNDYAL